MCVDQIVSSKFELQLAIVSIAIVILILIAIFFACLSHINYLNRRILELGEKLKKAKAGEEV